jgi:hypothetical protein
MKNSVALAVFAAIVTAAPAQAALTSYTSKAAFDSAIAGFSAAQTVDFDSISAGTLFASGTGTGGLTFTYSIAGLSIQVADTFGTTSGSNYLGLDNPDTAFFLGDSFSIDFNRTVHAVGLYVIAGRDAQAGDMRLSVASGSVSNSATADTLVSDGQAFYLGLVESDAGLGFTSATVSGVFTPNAFLAFTADDITVAGDITVSPIPEPEVWSMMLAGLGLLALRRMRNPARKV